MKKVAFFLLLLVTPARSDSWLPPRTFETTSANGRYLLVVDPVQLRGDSAYLEDKLRHRPHPGRATPDDARATLYALAAGQRRRLWSGPLVNEVSPLSALVAGDGRYAVTFDNWRGVGWGQDVVVVYGAGGKRLRQWSLEQLLSHKSASGPTGSGPAKPGPSPGSLTEAEFEDRPSPHSAARPWRRGAWIQGQTLFLATIAGSADGPLLAVDLGTGRVRPGTSEDVVRSIRVGDDLRLPLELAMERKLGGLQGPLRAILASHRPTGERLRAAAALAQQGDLSGLTLVQDVADHGQADERAYALPLLADLAGPQALPVLRQALRAGVGQANVWYAAQKGMVKVGKAALPMALEMLRERDQPADSRGAAAYVLGAIGDRAAVPALLEAVQDPDGYVADRALDSLRLLADDATPEELCRLLSRGTTQDGKIAAYLETVPTPSAVPALLSALERHPGDEVQTPAILHALQAQTGMHLGRDVTAWKAWRAESSLRAGPPLARGQALARLGDPAAGHWLARAVADDPAGARPALQQWRQGRARLAAWIAESGGTCRISPNGARALVGFQLWDLRAGRRVSTIESDTPGVHFSDDGQRLVVRQVDRVVVHNAASGAELGRFQSDGFLLGAALSPDGRRVAVLEDVGARVWDVASGQELDRVRAVQAFQAVFSPDGRRLLVPGRELVISEPDRHLETSCKLGCDRVQWLSRSESFLAGRRGGELTRHGPTGQLLVQLEPGPVELWVASPDESQVALALANGTVRIRDRMDGKLRLETRTSPASALAFSPDGSLLAVSSPETAVTVLLSTRDGAERGRLQFGGPVDGKPLWTHELAFQSNRRLVVPFSENISGLTLWDLVDLPPDEDAPAELEELNEQVCSGQRLDGNTLRQLSASDYAALRQRWAERAARHATECRTPAGNLWLQWGRQGP